mgnify:FL=1
MDIKQNEGVVAKRFYLHLYLIAFKTLLQLTLNIELSHLPSGWCPFICGVDSIWGMRYLDVGSRGNELWEELGVVIGEPWMDDDTERLFSPVWGKRDKWF